jgi:phenylacetate-CoA ligase
MAFNCPVRETYGMAEMVAMASECREGRLHLWPEVGFVEVVNESLSATLGDSGDLICTGLLNVDMPLIRYRVGDQGRLEIDSHTCPCGRALPVMASVDGRIADVLYTNDGRRVGRLSPVFKGDLAIREAQVIQETLNSVKVKVVATPGFASHHERVIVERLKERMGDVEVVIEPVAELPRGAGGKFRAVVCKIPGIVSQK